MKINLLMSCVFLFVASHVFAKSDACNVRFRCTIQVDPVICEIGDSNLLAKGNNRCLATATAYNVMCKLGLMVEDAPLNCQSIPQSTEAAAFCPQLFPAAPDFCEHGTIVVDKDSRGCELPPRCVQD